MPNKLIKFPLVVAFAFTLFASAKAQENNCDICRLLLVKGVTLDEKFVQSGDKKTLWKNYFCTSSLQEAYRTMKAANSGELGVSIPVLDVPLPFGGSVDVSTSSAEQSFNQWKSSNCGSNSGEDRQAQFLQYTRTYANPVLIEGFVKCVGSVCVKPPEPTTTTKTLPPFRAWNVIQNDKQVSVYISFTGEGDPPTVSQDVIVPNGVTRTDVKTEKDVLLKKGTRLGYGVTSFSLERQPNQTFQVTFRTDRGTVDTFVDKTPFSAIYKYEFVDNFIIPPKEERKLPVECKVGYAFEAGAVCTTGMGLCTFRKNEDHGKWTITVTNIDERQTVRGHTFAVCVER
jgi:hypothetical protein